MTTKTRTVPPLSIGEVRYYSKWDCPVYVTRGSLYSNGRISNFWYFNEVNDDGSLGREGHDYDNGPFGRVYKAIEKTTIEIIK